MCLHTYILGIGKSCWLIYYIIKAASFWPTEHTLYICFIKKKNMFRNQNKVTVVQACRIELNGHCG